MQLNIYYLQTLLCVLPIVWISCAQNQEPTLILTQVIYRHGDRSALDASENVEWQDSWTDGYAQLTNLGKQQQYELGQYFRRRYGKLLNTTYKKEEIKVWSTDRDRTLMSAYCNLAGLYPPQGKQVWNDAIRWQPIPVYIVPSEDEHIFLALLECPRYDKIKEAIKGLQNISENRSKQIHNLTQHDIENEAALNQLLKERSRFEGGPLLGELIKNMQNKLSGNVTEKMFMYSAHDTSLVKLLDVLEVYNGIWPPPYCSTIMLELYEVGENGRLVKLFYRNTTSHEPYELSIPVCPSPCPYEKFKLQTANMIPLDMLLECQDNGRP